MKIFSCCPCFKSQKSLSSKVEDVSSNNWSIKKVFNALIEKVQSIWMNFCSCLFRPEQKKISKKVTKEKITTSADNSLRKAPLNKNASKEDKPKTMPLSTKDDEFSADNNSASEDFSENEEHLTKSRTDVRTVNNRPDLSKSTVWVDQDPESQDVDANFPHRPKTRQKIRSWFE